MSKSDVKLEDIVSLCKRRGFIYQGSEIYGGLAGTWDYGPLGVQLKRNIMNLWWRMFVEDRDDIYGVDAAILMNKKVWEASRHVETFVDPMIECLNCQHNFRTDKLIDDKTGYSNILKHFHMEVIRKHIPHALSEADVIELQKKTKINPLDPKAQKIIDALKELDEWNNLSKSNGIIEQGRTYLGKFPQYYLNIIGQKCPKCGQIKFSESQQFNMMLKTIVGPKFRSIDRKNSEGMNAHIEFLKKDGTPESEFDLKDEFRELGGFMIYDANAISYLRPETAQGIFTNYRNIIDSFSPDLPFGIAQQGKAFRNEISPRDFVFRSREFEQMEIEYFIHPDNWEEEFEKWRKNILEYFDALGLPKHKLHELKVPEDDLAHYSKRTIDFEFDYPHSKDELAGFAYRTDFDLRNVARKSGKNMEYRPKDQSKPFVPHVIEPSFGVERAVMAVLVSAYREDEVNGEKRTYLALPEHLAPVKIAVSPLLKNKPELVKKAREVYLMLKEKHGNVMWDDNGNIGKRYRRQDEIGTPKCITIDFDTLKDNTVTVRDRDTTKQQRVKIDELVSVTN